MLGQFPRLDWSPNPDGSVRSITDAVEIARLNGVVIPDDVEFFVDDGGLLDEQTTARGPKVSKIAGGVVVWEDLLNRFGKVPFLVRPDILESDEGIVAVIAHELHELNGLRPSLSEEGLTIEEFAAHVSPANPGNLHDEAWDVADKLVAAMRRRANDSQTG